MKINVRGLSFLLLFCSDQLLKYFAFRGFFPYQKNTGVAFGMLSGSGYFAIGVYFLFGYFFYRWLTRSKTSHAWVGWVLYIGGSSSNILDRFIYAGVIDYIPFFGTRINLADICIIASLLILSYDILIYKPYQTT